MNLGEKAMFLTSSDIKFIKLWIEGIGSQTFKRRARWNYNHYIGLSYNIIGFGMSRVVFDLNNGFALKVATNAEGINCNKVEDVIYNFAPPSVKKYLAEVKEHGYGWIIMEKMKNVPDTEENREKVLRMKEKFKKYGIHAGDIVDEENKPKWKNIGINEEGKIKVVDYGHFNIFHN